MKKSLYIDNLKAVLIILVIYGHLLSVFSGTELTKDLYDIIYSFHMPLFLFISGLVSKRIVTLSTFQCIKQSFFKIMVPYLTAFYVYSIIGAIFLGDELRLNFMYPSFALWFLMALFIYRVTLKFCINLGVTINLIIGVVLYIFTTIILMPLNGISFLALNRVLGFYIFFISGYYLPIDYFNNKILEYKNSNYKYLMIGVGILGMIGISYLNNIVKLNSAFLKNKNYLDIGISLNQFVEMSIVALIITIAISLMFLVIIPTTRQKFSKLGRDTLYVYLLHILPLEVLHSIGSNIDLKLNSPVAVVIVTTSITIIVLFYCLVLINATRYIGNKLN